VALAVPVVGLVVGLVAAIVVAPAAQAAAYRYWTYWQAPAGSWSFATAGPAATLPLDGAVEGWRFAVTTQSSSAHDAPTVAADFAAICGSTPAVEGRKRVALVIDPGAPEIAPAGQKPPAAIVTCVVADPSATGYQVLRSATTVRTESGLICAVADYPIDECAPIVDEPVASQPASATAAPESSPTAVNAMAPAAATPGSGSPIATIVVAALLIAGAATWGIIRRRDTRAQGHD
jgi:hypothetical protein